MSEFKKFPKIKRLDREWIVTEKIDGTNAQIHITNEPIKGVEWIDVDILDDNKLYYMYAGSRNRYIYPGKEDNFGFALWVADNSNMLWDLGLGRHYGEWWGHKINRGYGLTERRFSLFNVTRWDPLWFQDATKPPACCHVVPIITVTDSFFEFADLFDHISNYMFESYAVPGYTDPEGFVVCHEPSGFLAKYTFDGDGHKNLKNLHGDVSVY